LGLNGLEKMPIIRVFPRQTKMTPIDGYSFVGDPPMVRPEADGVHVDCTFTWDKPIAERLKMAWGQYYPTVKLGGCAYDDPCDGFIPGRYIRRGVTFTSRGCNNQCPWCLVWQREGKLREMPIIAGNVEQSNNLLQCSHGHIRNVFSMLKKQRAIELAGGLDSRLITDDVADQIRSLRIKQIFLAADTKQSLKPLERAVKKLNLSHGRVRCYALLAFDGETISDAEERLRTIYEIGCLPFAQLYQPPDRWIEYSKDWRDLARTWSRPAAMKAVMKHAETI